MAESAPLEIADLRLRQQLERVMAASRYAGKLCQQEPRLLQALLDSGDLQRSYPEQRLQQLVREYLADCADRPQLLRQLRRLRQREWLRILWRDCCGLADTVETTRDLSLLAEACVEQSLEFLQRELAAQHGEPRDANGEAQHLLVIALGKLGGRELNLSSDIDLILAYPEAGRTDKGLENHQFFLQLSQRLVSTLEQVTSDGFVFRVDLRLRPFGRDGALAMSIAALEEYYQGHGRDWERYALVKARVISGDPPQARLLMETLRPFVYRHYLDYGAIESLRKLKAMIVAENRRHGLATDLKLGPGGIREVEFIVQCFQLIRGGRQPELQRQALLAALASCEETGCLAADVVAELRAAYLFLRDAEHAIQGYDDQQTQRLPDSEAARAALLAALDFPTWEDFAGELQRHRDNVSRHFAGLIAPAEGADPAVRPASPWPSSLDPESLSAAGFGEARRVSEQLREFQDSSRVRYLQQESSLRLDQFMPEFLGACLAADDPELALQRVLPLVQAVVRRSAYLVLLLENPAALRELIALCSASPWIAERLSSQPALLDELLDSTSLYSAVDREAQTQALRQQSSRLPEHDLEVQLEILGYFKAARQLSVAAAEVMGHLPLMQVSDRLTELAEVVVEQALAVAWRELTAKHGRPGRAGSGSGFAVIGYGKLGGIELGYDSDLDLVFIYDAAQQGQTDGERPLDHAQFYLRLGQRLIQILTARSAMGPLYEIDMRLRPSGSSGMLVASFAAYREYQLHSAWTWEHQALVRARFIAGDDELGQRFSEFRSEVLQQPRDLAKLAEDVVQMRERMRAQLHPGERGASGKFHLKQGRGGMVDIEFMVQYAVLAWSHQAPQLARWSDNVRILEALSEAGRFTEQQARELTEAYIGYRTLVHQLALQREPEELDPEQSGRAAVLALWEQLLGAVG